MSAFDPLRTLACVIKLYATGGIVLDARCTICGRRLNVRSDPLSSDCGGDCWGCIGPMEEGWPPSAAKVAEEIRDGLREPDGTAKPPSDE
jgi:hypothetical protein